MSSANPGQSRQEIENLEHILGSMKSFLFDYFQKLGPDPIQNIQQIVNTIGKVFSAAATLYNRLDESDGLLKTWAIDTPPPGFLYEDKPEGHVCYMMTIKERSPSQMTAVEIPDLDSTPFKDLDINVKNYNLKSYLAFPVALNEEVVGSLCVVFGQHRTFSVIDKDILEAFAKAVTLEEERKYAIETVQKQLRVIQNLNEDIVILNERLKEENLRMGAELDVVRQLQQAILPNPDELKIDGLDIAGFMEPADEVGGDYYDVLHIDDIVTLCIGDVTGHGLESGILMVMTQTAVRTLKELQGSDHVTFLDTLNRTLYKNLQRMNSDRNLTLAVLNYSHGKLSISGQHEETIVVRKGGHIERIDTMDLGFPLGLSDDIAEFISHTSVELEIGDGIVLYTDGITEAKNLQKEQYGIERLCQSIEQHWEKPADGIKQGVIADVRTFIGTQKVFDDITLLVFKRISND